MKLKEKLAQEYANKQECDAYSYGKYAGFLAGFEKAREMAGYLILTSWTDLKYFGLTFPIALKNINDDCKAIGEEEVE